MEEAGSPSPELADRPPRRSDSWIVDEPSLDRCFQLMETDDPSLFEVWLANWRDLGEYEVLPVIDSAAAAARVDIAWHGGNTA
jgi:hypothetical protein